jgi:protein-disulfide isomerase
MSEPRKKPQPFPSTVRWIIAPLIFAGAVSAWLALAPSIHGTQGSSEAIAAEAGMSKSEFEQRVHDHLLEHPEVIAEAINRLEAQQREQEAKQVRTVLQSRADEVYRDPHAPVGGNSNGDTTLVEFFDYNCPYCKQMASVMAQVEAADPRLRVVYKEFPILGPDSLLAAKAALAANKQGKYVAFHRALYQVRGHLDESRVLETAQTAGLDIARLKSDMQAPEIGARLAENIRLAQALGISGTPGFAVGDKILVGAMDLKSLQTAIEVSRKSPVTAR